MAREYVIRLFHKKRADEGPFEERVVTLRDRRAAVRYVSALDNDEVQAYAVLKSADDAINRQIETGLRALEEGR